MQIQPDWSGMSRRFPRHGHGEPNRRGRTRAFSVGIAGLAVACVLVFAASAAPPVLDIEGMTYVSSYGSQNELVVRSRFAAFETDREIARLREVSASVKSSEQRPGFDMVCDRAELDLTTNDFFAEGNVEGKTEGGRKFSADWVRYDHEQSMLFTDAPVVITEESGTAFRGGGFRYYVDEQRFRLLGGASVVQP